MYPKIVFITYVIAVVLLAFWIGVAVIVVKKVF